MPTGWSLSYLAISVSRRWTWTLEKIMNGCRVIRLIFGGVSIWTPVCEPGTSKVALVVKNGKWHSWDSACHCRRHKRHRFGPWVRKMPWRRAWQPTLEFLPGESHRQRSLAGYSSWGSQSRTQLKQLSMRACIVNQRSVSLQHGTSYLDFTFLLCLVGFSGDVTVIPRDIGKWHSLLLSKDEGKGRAK